MLTPSSPGPIDEPVTPSLSSQTGSQPGAVQSRQSTITAALSLRLLTWVHLVWTVVADTPLTRHTYRKSGGLSPSSLAGVSGVLGGTPPMLRDVRDSLRDVEKPSSVPDAYVELLVVAVLQKRRGRGRRA